MNNFIITLSFLILAINLFGQNQKNSVNVVEVGANGFDLIDDTKYFQKAIDQLANKKGGALIIPKGTYYISKLKFIGKKYSNISIQGDDVTIVQLTPPKRLRKSAFNTYAEDNGADGCFIFDANISNQKNDYYSIKNIKIVGLTFMSKVQEKGFDELLHQISAHGVSNLEISNCKFIGFLGDGIAINGGINFSKKRNAYNKNIKIINCFFDGINKDNRQGISIYYSDGFRIENCTFQNITRKDMPGAIDIESDELINVTRNGSIINCNFNNIGGIGAIVFNIRPSTKLNDFSYKNFLVDNCKFRNTQSAITVIGNESFRSFKNEEIITLSNLEVTNSFALFDFRKAYGVTIKNVTARNITNTFNNIVSDGGAHSISFFNCTFDGFANPHGLGFTGDLYNINFNKNKFINFTNNAITINTLTGLGQFINNEFISTKAKGGFPLVTQYFSSKDQIKNAYFYKNKSYNNFKEMNINFFYKSK